MENLLDNLKTLLQKDERFISEGELLKNKVVELALKLDKDLIELLLSDKQMKEIFFVEISPSSLRGAERRSNLIIFDKDKFIRFVSNKQFLPDSYTSFKNKIGLTLGDEFLSEKKEVVLSWPYKDCVLEGGMSKEDQKRNEIFWNEILAPDEISRLFDPKVFTNAKRIDKNGEHPLPSLRGAKRRGNPVFRTDENGDIKGDYQVDARGTSALLVKETQAAAITNFLGVVGSNPVFAPVLQLKAAEILRQWAKTQSLPASMLPTDEELEEFIKKQQEQQGEQPQDSAIAVEQMRMDQQQAKFKFEYEMFGAKVQAGLQEAASKERIEMMRLAQNDKINTEKLIADLKKNQAKLDSDWQQFMAELNIKYKFESPTANYGLGE